MKKPAVREAILGSALRLFSQQGYDGTTLSQIAAGAGVSTANVYVYFASKLEVLYALYDPWLRERMNRLGKQLERVRDPRRRLRILLGTLWRDIPAERNGFANNVMQAVSTSTSEERYNPRLLNWVEKRIAAMIGDALPCGGGDRRKAARLAHLLMMALDGFVINYHLRPGKHCSQASIELMCDLLLAPQGRAGAGATRPSRQGPSMVRHRIAEAGHRAVDKVGSKVNIIR